jgi:hypothetical protein
MNSMYSSICGFALRGSLAAAILLAAGHAADAANNVAATEAAPVPVPSPPAGNSARDARLRAAAEPFERLTETAFSAPTAALDASLKKAEEGARSVRPLLPPPIARRLADHLSVLRAAARKHDRATVALASIEIYRDFVSSVSAEAKVPNSVSLLDYAGLRYGADLNVKPIRWSDMEIAARVAEDQWGNLAPKVASPALAAEMERAIAGMATAAKHKNEASATHSAKTELDLVDRLETHFASR